LYLEGLALKSEPVLDAEVEHHQTVGAFNALLHEEDELVEFPHDVHAQTILLLLPLPLLVESAPEREQTVGSAVEIHLLKEYLQQLSLNHYEQTFGACLRQFAFYFQK
jgi:hypothetical protein